MAANPLLAQSQINVLTMRYHLESIHTENLTKTAGYEARISEHCRRFQEIVARAPQCVHYNLTLHGKFCLNGVTFDAIADEDYSQTTLLVFALQHDAPLSIFQALLDAGAEIAPQTVLSITCPKLRLPIEINDVNAFIALTLNKDRRDIIQELTKRQLLTQSQADLIVSNQVKAFHDQNPSESFSLASPPSNHQDNNDSIVLSGFSNFFQRMSDRIQHGSPLVIESKNLGPSFQGKN